MHIEQKPISEIQPYEKNAKKHPDKQVKQIVDSIREFGFNQPIVVDKNNVIIVGHGRYMAAHLLGMEMVPTLTADLTEGQAKAYRLADNKLNESDWDMELVINELRQISPEMVDLTGFSRDLVLESQDKDDDVPETPTVAKSAYGDIYQLGRHRVMCGDSTKMEDVEKLMGGGKADMVFTDPPYNVAYHGMQNSKQWENLKNDVMSAEEFRAFLTKAFQQYALHCKKDAALYVCHADANHNDFKEAIEQNEYQWRATIIWVKNSPAFNFAQYKYKHEPIFYCVRNDTPVRWYGDMTNNTVWREEWSNEKIIKWFKNALAKEAEMGKTTIWEAKKQTGDHPTIKPVELISKALINSSKREDIILDLFGGSGSTLIASHKLERICYTMELEPKYVDVIIKRWEDYTGEKAIKL